MATETILITGGTGFAGSHLAEYLRSTQPEAAVHVTSFQTTHSATLPSGVQVHPLNLLEVDQLKKLLKELQPTQIYHLASWAVVQNSFAQARDILHNNCTLQINLLDAVRDVVPSARLLVVSSGECYGAPTIGADGQSMPLAETSLCAPNNPYAISKMTQEHLALAYHRAFQLQLMCVRPFNHTGERQQPSFVVPALAKQIVAVERGQQPVVLVGNLTATRDFSDVKDIVRGYAQIMSQGTPGAVYNLGSGVGRTVQSVLDDLVKLSNHQIAIEVDRARYRPNDTPWIVADIRKAGALGWQPQIPWSETLARVLKYWRSL